MDAYDMTYIIPVYDPISDLEPGVPVSATSGTAEDLALLDAYSRAVVGAVDRVGPAVLHLQVTAANNRANGSSDENKSIVQGSIAYFGTYTLDPADGTLTLHIDRSSFPNWNGTDIKRMITSLTTQELKYTNPAASVGGSAELAWKKVK